MLDVKGIASGANRRQIVPAIEEGYGSWRTLGKGRLRDLLLGAMGHWQLSLVSSSDLVGSGLDLVCFPCLHFSYVH